MKNNSSDPKNTEDWSRKPEIIIPGDRNHPPSDALVLYRSADDAEKWEHLNGDPIRWDVGDYLTVTPGSGDIRTKQIFGDAQLHLEWKSPDEIEGEGQGRGNSGIFLMDLYEIQVLDSYRNETYYNGMAGSIYKQHIPLVNACRPPGHWQYFDIIFNAPVFGAHHELIKPAYVTILHNDILIQNHVALEGPTRYKGKPQYTWHETKLPLRLQDHDDRVSFRNIWIREI